MTLFRALALFATMGLLAALPSSSVALVVARSATLGTHNGLATAAGVVSGDLIFMTLALLGLSALAEQLGTVFVVVKYAAAAFLIWFGICLIWNRNQQQSWSQTKLQNANREATLAASFSFGLLLTLGDLKAIFFYASLLPIFVDFTAVTPVDIAIIAAITIVAVGGVKATYAFAAGKLAGLEGAGTYQRELKVVSGSVMTGLGAYLMLRD